MSDYCKYCEKLISKYTNPAHGTEHFRHERSLQRACVLAEIHPNNPHYAKPACHVCKATAAGEHKSHCSFMGDPIHVATPIGSK